MSEVRSTLVIESQVKGAGKTVTELSRVADGLERVSNAADDGPSFDDFDFSAMADSVEDMSEHMDHYVDEARHAVRETQRLGDQQENNTRSTREGTAASRAGRVELSAKQKLEAQIGELKDASLATDRRALALAREGERLADGMAVSADQALGAERRSLALQQESERLATQQAALVDDGLAAKRQEIALLRESEILAAQELSLGDGANAATRERIALERQRESLLASMSAMGDADIQDAEKLLMLAREKRSLEVKIEAAQDGEAQNLREQLGLVEQEQASLRSIAALQRSTAQGKQRDLDLEEAKLKEIRSVRQRLLLATDQQVKALQRAEWVQRRMLAIDHELQDLNHPMLQAERSKLEVERQRLKVVDEIAEIIEARGEAADTDGLLRMELKDLKEKLKLLEQEKSLMNSIREAQRLSASGAPGADLRDAQNINAQAHAWADLGDEQARAHQIMNDPAFRRKAIEVRNLQQRAELATRTWRDYVSDYTDILEKVDSSIQVWFTLGMVIQEAFKVFLDGSISAGIAEANERLGEYGKTAEIAAGAGGVLTKKQAGSASLRAAELGVSKESSRLASFATGLGGRQVLLGESDDMGAATLTALQQLQEEFSKGELGQNFKDLGVSVSQYDQAVRRAAAQRGVLPDALDLQTRKQILLAQATKDSTARLALYNNEQVRQAVGVKNFFLDTKAALGEVFSGGSTYADNVKALERQVTELKGSLVQLEGGLKNAPKSGKASEAFGELEGAAIQTRQTLEARQKELATVKELERLAATQAISAELGKQMDTLLLMEATGGQEIMMMMEELSLEGEMQRLGLQQEQAAAIRLRGSKLLTVEMLEQLRTTVGQQGIQEIYIDMQSKALVATLKASEAKLAGLKSEREQVRFMEIANGKSRAVASYEMAEREAKLQFETDFLKMQELKGKTLGEAQLLLKDERIQGLMGLEVAKALNAEKLKYTELMTENQKNHKQAIVDVAGMKEQIWLAVDGVEGFQKGLGRAVAVKAFSKLSDDGQLLLEKLMGGKDQLDQMILSAGRLGGALNAFTGGKLFSDNFLERLWMKGDDKDKDKDGKKDKKTGRSKSGDDDFLEQLRREKIERDMNARRGSAVSQTALGLDQLTQLKTFQSFKGEDSIAGQAVFGDAWDETLAQSAVQLEWWYLDAQKKAGESGEKMAAMEIALVERRNLIIKEAEDRRTHERIVNAKAGMVAFLETTRQEAAAGLKVWGDYQKEYLFMQNETTRREQENYHRARLERMTSGDEDLGGLDLSLSAAGKRRLNAKEKELVTLREATMREMNAEIEAHNWSAKQKIEIETQYQARLREIERQFNQERFAENQKLREATLASAEASLQASQELMSKFSDEARSMSEGSQATFQGGLTQLGKDLAGGFDIATVSLMGLTAGVGELDKASLSWKEMRAAQEAGEETALNGVSITARALAGGAAAASKYTDSIVKDERAKAGIKGAMEVALSIGDYASQNYVGGTLHALAAAKFFAIAATAQTAPAKAAKAEATKKTALSSQTVALTRDRGPSVITNVFVQMQPITGRSIVETVNGAAGAGSMYGRAIDSRLLRPTASVRSDL